MNLNNSTVEYEEYIRNNNYIIITESYDIVYLITTDNKYKIKSFVRRTDSSIMRKSNDFFTKSVFKGSCFSVVLYFLIYPILNFIQYFNEMDFIKIFFKSMYEILGICLLLCLFYSIIYLVLKYLVKKKKLYETASEIDYEKTKTILLEELKNKCYENKL